MREAGMGGGAALDWGQQWGQWGRPIAIFANTPESVHSRTSCRRAGSGPRDGGRGTEAALEVLLHYPDPARREGLGSGLHRGVGARRRRGYLDTTGLRRARFQHENLVNARVVSLADWSFPILYDGRLAPTRAQFALRQLRLSPKPQVQSTKALRRGLRRPRHEADSVPGKGCRPSSWPMPINGRRGQARLAGAARPWSRRLPRRDASCMTSLSRHTGIRSRESLDAT
jgi:hypothetical protein